MPERRASFTAVLVCQGRAVAHGRIAPDRFADPTAMALLRPDEQAQVHRVRDGAEPGDLGARMTDEMVRAAAELIVPRTVAIDAALAARPAPQVVVLGAGLDGRAWRMSALAGTEVFEVDQPASQRDKRDRAAALPADRAPHFVPVDFGDPRSPDVGDPTTAGVGDPKRPGPGDPRSPDVGDPTTAGLGDPRSPDGGDPKTPGLGDPKRPGLGDPKRPGPGDPTTPDLGDPTTPGLSDPTTPGPGDPTTPDLGDPTTPDPGDPKRPGPRAPGLAGALAAAGHRADQPTTWVWEGAVPYLTRPQVSATVAAVAAASAPGSRLIVNYQAPSVLASAARQVVGTVIRATGRTNPWAAEPWRSTWTAAAMAGLLGRHGFSVGEDHDLLMTATALGMPIRQRRSHHNGRLAVADL